MINKDDYRIDEVDGKWVLSKDDYENDPIILLKRKEKKYIFEVFRGIRSGSYNTEEELLEDIENIPEDISNMFKAKYIESKFTYTTTYSSGFSYIGNNNSSTSSGRSYLNWYV
mgnify:CR=1 FL=1